MARDPAGVYSYPHGIDGSPDQTIISNDYNSFLRDVQQDLNYPRPILSGGTGATNAHDAMVNLKGEIAQQLVDNYDMFSFVSGSFYSIGGATSEPVAGHNFIGICYAKDVDNIVIEARDESDTTKPGRIYVREKKITAPATSSAWLPWKLDGRTNIDNGGGDIIDGISGDAADMFFGLRGTAPTSYFTVNTKSDVSGTDVIKIGKDGSITFAGTPSGPTSIVNKSYVDAADAALQTAVNGKVAKSGDTMVGDLTVSADIHANRNANEGVIFLGSNGQHYLYWNGANYSLPAGKLTLGAQGTGGNDAVTFDQLAAKQNNLGFTPVTQGGTQQITLRYDGGGTRLQVDNNDTFGHIMTDNNIALAMGARWLYGGDLAAAPGDLPQNTFRENNPAVISGWSWYLFNTVPVISNFRFRYLQLQATNGSYYTIGFGN